MEDGLVIYRSMCTEELNKTMASKRFSFNQRFKWFTPTLEYQSRVRDGLFNNSNACIGRYINLVAFTIRSSDVKFLTKIGVRELMLDVRQAHNVLIINISNMDTIDVMPT